MKTPPKSQSLRVIVKRIGEPLPTESQYRGRALDAAQVVCNFWHDVVELRDDHEPDKEHLIVLLLNTKLHLIAYNVVSMGSLNETTSHPREIFRSAIVMAAYGFVLVHNHPSGIPSPSNADQRLTRKIVETASAVDIKFLDHVIIGGVNGDGAPFYSFREAGLV